MKSDYKVENIIGLDYFITDTKGIGGRLRQEIEDFQVEELFNPSDENPDGEYTHFVMEKRDWDTLKALKRLSRALRVSRKRFGFAGTKDKRAVTRQRVAVWNVKPEVLEKVRLKDISLSDFKRSDSRVNLGNANGNRFSIVLRDIDGENLNSDLITKTNEQLLERGIPNFFGYQRFGVIRPNTHQVGRELVNGNIDKAVMAYLGNPFENEREDAYTARKSLEETGDYKEALKNFPKRLNYERTMLQHLSQVPNDYAGALRKLPKKLRWMLGHAYQSYLYNKVLSGMIEKGLSIQDQQIPLFGYDSMFSEGDQGEIEKSVLDEESLTFEDFKNPSMPELTLKGLLRDACIKTEISYKAEEDELNDGK
ncbi:MAG: tRNA pseudouridine(13) synthase TruD, partial [Candidatus Hydrothermarchaeales archaeon]